MAEVAFHEKRRGVVKASLTKLGTKLTDLEGDSTVPTLLESAKNLADKLDTLRQDFKTHQLAIIDRNEGEALAGEQQVLDDHDDQVSELSVRIQRLINLATKAKIPDVAQVADRQLTLLQTKLDSINAAIRDLDDTEDDAACSLEEYRDQVTEVKTELAAIESSLFKSDIRTDDPVMQSQARVDKAAFDCQLKIRKCLRTLTATPAKSTEPKASKTIATKLPKLELPTFHCDILR